jgi:hypothetical protein
MESPALAIAWEFRARHRWGVIAVAGYLLALTTFNILFLEPGHVVKWDPADGTVAAVGAQFGMTVMYLVGVFSFGFTGDLTARESIYPLRMFTLPVTTTALAGWPMLYGTVAVASLWVITALVGRWSWGVDLPLVWPALLAAAWLAWTQALTWMPYSLPGLRVIVTVLCLVALDAVILLALNFGAREALMVAFLAPQLPIAFLVARRAVARARRGDVPDWRNLFVRRPIAIDPRNRRAQFSSPARAQTWFEWRRLGRSLPVWVGILLLIELATLFLARDGAPSLVFYTLFFALVTPLVMAAFVALSLREANPDVRDNQGMASFLATRPLTSAALVAAKLTMALWTTLATWLLVLIAIPLALTLSHTWAAVIEPANRGIEAIGMPRAIVLALLLFAGLLASTWKQLVQGLYIGLTGRAWVMKVNATLLIFFAVLIGPFADWIMKNGNVRGALWDALPSILATLMFIKMAAATWIAIRLQRSHLLGDRALITGAAVWLAAVLVLYALLVWFVDTPLIARYFLMLIAILAVPLVRVSAAPLALAWNRHR